MASNTTWNGASKEELIRLLTKQAGVIECLEMDIMQLNLENAKPRDEDEGLRWENIQLKGMLTRLSYKFEGAQKDIAKLQEELRVARLSRNSSNSSMPPSTDLFKPKRNKAYSLRKKTGRKSGGQPGHRGTTLEFCNDAPDQVIPHSVECCSVCGKDLSDVTGEIKQIHQVVDISVPKRILINHTLISKQCSCGHCNQAEFPAGARGPVNYGNMIRGLVANLSVRQYMPYKRTVEFLNDIFGISMSEGTLKNLLEQFTDRAQKTYLDIHQQVYEARVVGADETSVKVNGIKEWFHTYQTYYHTFIGHHPSRGSRAQETFYPGGLPNAILVSDCYAMQLSTPSAAHQLCHAHLARELNAFEEAYPSENWPRQVKALFRKALQFAHSPPDEKQIKSIEDEFEKLLQKDQSQLPGKIPAFWKRMKSHKDKVFTFLHYSDVPPDNNGSERAIRNAKVKQKVSGQFKTPEGATRYAIIRSVIDTLIKQNQNVHEGLAQIAALSPAGI